MNLLVIAVIVVAVVGLLVVLKAKEPGGEERISFESRGDLFSPAERSFLGVLEQVVDDRHRVLGKVRLGDLVQPAKGLSKSKATAARNKINQKHVDFVVCSVTDLKVVGVVELDDQTHARADRGERDVFVDHALQRAGIPIARFSAKKGYQVQEVRAKLVQAFNLTEDVPTPATNDVTPPQRVSANEPTPAPTTISPIAATEVKEEVPNCGKCGAAMVKRQAKNGPHAGKLFWACSTFPRCRQVVPLPEGTA